MSSATDAYFDALQQRGHVPEFRHRKATVRFDVVRDGGTDHWTIMINNGDLTVSQSSTQPADCIIAGDEAVLDRLLTGQTNGMAAMLRGTLRADGDLSLLVATRRLLPDGRQS